MVCHPIQQQQQDHQQQERAQQQQQQQQIPWSVSSQNDIPMPFARLAAIADRVCTRGPPPACVVSPGGTALQDRRRDEARVAVLKVSCVRVPASS